jgi:hypothetical protein
MLVTDGIRRRRLTVTTYFIAAASWAGSHDEGWNCRTGFVFVQS